MADEDAPGGDVARSASAKSGAKPFWADATRIGSFWLLLAVACLAGALGLTFGYFAAKQGLIFRARAHLEAMIADWRDAPPNAQIQHSERTTALHTLAITHLPLERAWALAEADGHLLFATRGGQFGFVSGDRVATLDLQAPLGWDAFNRSALASDPAFDIAQFRVTDLLTVQTAPHSFDLYVAHISFADECFRLAVHRIALATTPAGVEPRGEDWAPVFRTRDCIQPKQGGDLFAGAQSGGRLVLLRPGRLALSVGDFEFDGVHDLRAVSMDPASDLGKVHEIDLASGRARILTSGHRNPQGLLAARDGALWETEHGPAGGDELNLLRPGANYGWPRATYGMAYASTPTPWPLTPAPRPHEGYEPPRFAFLPSIGVSNLIEPDPREFPNWGEHLLVAALRGEALYLLRLAQGRVVYSEPILMPGDRVRDIINLSDGRIAFSTDRGDIQIIANADAAPQAPAGRELAGLAALPPRLPQELGPNANEPLSMQWGRRVFRAHCASCHSIVGRPGVGPSLDGVVGRRVGGQTAFNYSPALAGRHERWSKQRLRSFIRDAEALYPGVAMPAPSVDPIELDYLVDFIAAQHPVQPPR